MMNLNSTSMDKSLNSMNAAPNNIQVIVAADIMSELNDESQQKILTVILDLYKNKINRKSKIDTIAIP